MAKVFTLVSFLCLVVITSAFKLQESDMKMFRDPYNQEERMEAFEEEDEPEAIMNTNRLLEAIMLDQATIKGGSIEWFYRKGEVLPCVNGKKKIAPRCRWTGLVKGPGESKPKMEKLQVIGKYCNQAGLTKPEYKMIDC